MKRQGQSRLRQYLRILLATYGHTQESVAKVMNIDRSFMSRLPDTSPRPATLDALCTAIGCDSNERLEVYRLAKKVPPEIAEAFCESQVIAQLFRMITQMGDAEVKRAVAEFNKSRSATEKAE